MKKKGAFSKALVAFIVVLNVIFTASVLVVYWHTGTEPVTLIGAWFAFTTGELFMVAKIKRDKIKEGSDNDQLEAEINEQEILGGSSGVCDGDPDGTECVQPDD